MKVFYNKNFPAKGFIWNCFGVLFARDGVVVDEVDENHEMIHCYQMVEVAILVGAVLSVLIPIFGWSWWWLLTAIPAFYIWYGIEFSYQWIGKKLGFNCNPYRLICFEQEAYANDQNLSYRSGRRLYAWTSYLFSRVIY